MIDCLAYEPHFIDHTAPVWLALPEEARGRYRTNSDLLEHAESLGIEAEVAGYPKSFRTQPLDSETDMAFIASYGDLKKGRRMGYRRFAFMEHGIGQSYSGDRQHRDHPSYSGGSDRAEVELNLVPNENAAARWRASYPQTRTEVVGCPKLDTLPARVPGPGPVVAVSFHWPYHTIPETDSAFGHFASALPALAKAYTVIGHAHPRFTGAERKFRKLGIPFVADFADVCRQADLYVCDNSSSMYEFASTGRPVLVLNPPAYRREVTHGLRFWEAAEVGINVNCPCDLVALVGEALKDDANARADREAALDIVYAYRTGAAQRAADALTEWAGVRVAVAA